MKKKSVKEEWPEEALGIPNWLRIVLIIIAILALISIMFKAGPPRTDFPVFK